MDKKTLIFKMTQTELYGVWIDPFVSWDRTIDSFTVWLKGDQDFIPVQANVPGGPFSAKTDENGMAKFTFLISDIVDETRAKILIFSWPSGYLSTTYINGKNKIIIPVIIGNNR